MFPEFDSSTYFINLLALSAVLAPLHFYVPSILMRRCLLTLAGAYLIYFIAPRLLVFYAFFWTLTFILQRMVAYSALKERSSVNFWLSLLLMFLPMIAWKLGGEEFSISFNLIGNELLKFMPSRISDIDFARDIIIPIGLSFATFRAIDLLIKTHLGQYEGLSYDRVLFYGFFPSVQVAGPIIEYNEIQKQGDSIHRPSAEDIFTGLMRIVFGIIKVFIIATLLQDSSLIFLASDTMSTRKVWLYLFVYAWFFYINFSGYSDLAVGISRLFGFKLKENFNFPFFKPNISEFWKSWHMSLSRFAQRNAFIPLGGYRQKTQYIAILGTIMVIALWHDLTLGMVVFGIYHGVGLILHRVVSDQLALKSVAHNSLFQIVKIAATHAFVVLSFPLLVLPLEQAGGFYLGLVGR